MNIINRHLLFFLSTVLIVFNSDASCYQKGRSISDFEGDKLIIGRGKHIAPLSLEKTDLQNYYTIDIDAKLLPCMVANGLSADTYIAIPDNRFSEIIFEHMSFSSIYDTDFFTITGYSHLHVKYFTTLKWQSLLGAKKRNTLLQSELYRIVAPGGCLTFKSFVMKSSEVLEKYGIWNTKEPNNLPIGLQVWKTFYEEVGFEDITFTLEWHPIFKGYYIQMATRKNANITRENSLQSTVPLSFEFE